MIDVLWVAIFQLIINMRIVIIQYWSYYLSGNVFYLEELAQYLEKEYNLDVYVYNVCKLNDRKLLLERYNCIVKETDFLYNDDIIFTTVNGLIDAMQTNHNLLKKVYKIIVISNASIMSKFKKYIKLFFTKFLKYSYKFYLLIDPLYYNGSEKLKLFENRVIHYTRGFYFNRYSNECTIDNRYLLYYTKVEDYDIQPYFNEIEKYCYNNKLQYLYGNEDNFKSYNAASIYAGLFYTRTVDYTPRFPYEFWYYSKPVVFFNRSDGLLKRYSELELPLKRPIIHTNIFELKMENMSWLT